MTMKKWTAIAAIALSSLVATAAEPWQEVTMPTVSEAAKSFPNPPREYAAIHWAIWGGQITKERILSDITNVNASGGGVYMINNSRALRPAYFTPEYLDLVKYAVDECKKRGMKVWIEGDAGYPDGMAGGMIAKQYPQLGMQGIIPDLHYTVAAGKTLNIPLPTDTLGIFATQRPDVAPAAPAQDGKEIPLPPDGKLKWLCPSGASSEVILHAPSGDAHYSVVPGQTLAITIPPDTQSITSAPRTGGGRGGARGARGGTPPTTTIIPVPANGTLNWTAPGTEGSWDLTFVRHLYRSSPTRFSDREDGTADKDSLYTLIDYLDPQATATYLKLIHEKYREVVGDEFGKTILGFRGDETDYTGLVPWTPKLLETFKAQKGYDLQPYIASMFMNPLTPEAKRVKADYFDVWSGMFRDNFYKPLQEWARTYNMDYMMHLNHEETMLNRNGGEGMISNEGSFFRDLRYMGVPGVDNLNQIAPGITADFPKLAASVSHMFGRSLVWEEEGGSTGQTGKFIADYQFARGMNYMNMRGLNGAPTSPDKVLNDPAAATGWYVTRTQHLLAIGRPAAQIALFHPTDSEWLGDQEADDATVKLTTELIAHQIDFDHLDSDSLGTLCTLEGGALKNDSGQSYRGVIIPSCTVIQKTVLDRLRAFAAAGGKVVFVGRTPTMVVDKSFLNPEPGAPDLSFATLEPTPDITDKVIAALPKPDVQLDTPDSSITYIHRTLKDGDVYFFFNESAQSQSRTATLQGNGQPQIWDATTGTIHPLAGTPAAKGSITIPLTLAYHEARFIIIGPLPTDTAAPFADATHIASTLDGDWSFTVGEKKLTSPLKSWQDLTLPAFSGIADYHKTFDAPASLQPGQHVFLDLGNAAEIADVILNGKDLKPKSWTPFVWDITDALKSGSNDLEVKVQVPAGGGRGGGGGGGGGAPPTTGAAAGRRPANSAFGPAPAATPSGLIGPVRLMTQ